ncbi:MAG: cation:proton antiporter [Deltaproteobacteria bacterium]|nr:cation:proton antiporter [Deltaproteobacteria bacterium]
MHGMNLLTDLILVLAVALAVVLVLRRLHVPTLAGFIISGVVVGPGVLGLVGDPEEVALLAEVGVVLLLFGIGLELSLERLRRLWRPVLVGGALQVSVTGAIAAGTGFALGLSWPSAVFVGFLAAVSSTAIVLRGLAERGEVQAPHGRLTLGILVFQDLSVVPMMLAIPLLAGASQGLGPVAWAAARAIAVLAGVLVVARLVAPRVLHLVALTRQRDLFVLAVVVLCVGTAWAATGAGVSLALGAFLGGLVVADSEYRHQALADLIPLREVFASLFFVSIGMLLDLGVVVDGWWRIGLMVAGIIHIKFAVVVAVALVMRLPLRVAILAGTALAQVGEFSFVLLASAEGTGLLPPVLASDITAAAILTMLVARLGLSVGPHLAAGAGHLGPLTRWLDVRGAKEETDTERSGHVIVAGYGVAGRAIASAMRTAGVPCLVVDLNPSNVRRAVREGAEAVYGDVTSHEVLEHLQVKHASCMMLAISDPNANEQAVRAIRKVAPDLPLGVRALYASDVGLLREAGATEVFSAEISTAIEMLHAVLARHGVPVDAIECRVEEIREAWERGGRPGTTA